MQGELLRSGTGSRLGCDVGGARDQVARDGRMMQKMNSLYANLSANATASSSSSAAVTREMPTLDPMLHGFTNNGKGSLPLIRFQMPSKSFISRFLTKMPGRESTPFA